MPEWAEVKDEKSGKTYYYNKATKETTWSKPEELGGDPKKKKKKKDKSKKKKKDKSRSNSEDEDVEDNAANWATNTDPKSGKTYYYNKKTKKTSWKKPACMQSAAASEDDSDSDSEAARKAAKKAKKAKKAAAAGAGGAWSEATDPKSGKTYWYNRETKKTTWKNPNAGDDDDDSSSSKKKKSKKPRKATEEPAQEDSDDSDQSDASEPAATTRTTRQVDSDDDDDDDSDDDDDRGNDTRNAGGADSDDSDDSDAGARGGGNLQDDDDDDDEDEESDDDDDAEPAENHYKFAKHRKGWINRKFRVGKIHDDSTLLTFKKSLIKKALLKQNRDLDQEAVQAFKNVMSYMGDRKSSKKPVDHAKKMLHNLMQAPAGLRDEVYMQICKQTTRNPRVASTIRGWELMSYCLATFPPSKHLKTFLLDYIKKTVKEAKDDKVVELARVCEARVPKIIKMGQRKQVPSRIELECLKDVKPVPIRVSLVNGTFKSFNVDPYTLVKEVQDQLVEKYNLTVTKPFGMYEAAEANVERILDSKDRILDVQASWENSQKDGKDGKKKAADAAAAAGGVKESHYSSFLYKAKLVLKTNNQELVSDPEAINLIYIQATHDVVTSRYPANEKDITVLAALQLQATFGDFKGSVHVPGWLAPKIAEFMPRLLLEKKGKKSDKLEKEWEQKILAKYAKVSGFTSLEAKLNYLDYVQEWTFYGSTFFSVEQRQFKDYPSPLTLGINCEGVILMHPEKQTVLENYGFTDIVTWGHSDEKFIVVVGNIVQQRKLIFKTREGKAMNHLIHDYVKNKVGNRR